VISRRGVGKTFSVLKELIKLSQLPDQCGYTTFLYVSDKTNNATVNELINLVALLVRIVGYTQVLPVLHDFIDAKSAYEDILNKNLQLYVSDETKKDLFEILDLQDWTIETPHTAILLDDSINILKDNKFKQLRDLLFQNRQPRLTIFTYAQDIFGIPVQIRRNCDSIWIFSRMRDKTMFSMIMSQVGLSGREWWEIYNELNFRDVMILDFSSDGTKIKFLKN
jgi:hypothetical protein